MNHQHQQLARLTSAFEAFTATAGQLESAYRTLQQQAASLAGSVTASCRERDAARQQATDADRRLGQLVAALPAAVVVLDAAGAVTQASDAAIESFGEPLVGERWLAVMERTGASQPTGQPTNEITLRDGRNLLIASREIGVDAGMILLISDVSSQRKLEDVIARHRRLATLGEMAATLAHQIRTPLSAALLYASNAANRAIAGETRDAMLSRAIGCLNDLEKLVSDMLGFARGAAGSDGNFEPRDVIAAVRAASQAMVRPGQSLVFDDSPGGVRISGNREALSGALLNLVTNALQAAGPSAVVRLSVRQARDHVEFSVADNGPGVPARLRERIFDPFYTSRAEGTGLGLAVVRSVAEAHGGTVTVADNTPRGARFTIWLPLPGQASGQHGKSRRRSSRREHEAA